MKGKLTVLLRKNGCRLLNSKNEKCHEFVVPMGENQEPITEIELDRFVSFVENPVEISFLKSSLACISEMNDDRIEESETSLLNVGIIITLVMSYCI